MEKNIYLGSFIALGVLLNVLVYAETDQPVSTDKEYEDVVVALIDHKSGMMGVTWTAEGSEKEEKLSFQVDTNKVDVTNLIDQYLEFSNISVGDHIDIVTVNDPNGKETVVEIVDYNAFDPDA